MVGSTITDSSIASYRSNAIRRCSISFGKTISFCRVYIERSTLNKIDVDLIVVLIRVVNIDTGKGYPRGVVPADRVVSLRESIAERLLGNGETKVFVSFSFVFENLQKKKTL